jgi:hypothetical protein
MRITVVGAGYVVLITGVYLAEAGNQVYCLDIDDKKIDILNADGIPIFEPGFQSIVRPNIAAGRLTFGTNGRLGPFLPAYRRYDHRTEEFPNAYAHQSTILSLPLFPEMTSAQHAHVVAQVSCFK